MHIIMIFLNNEGAKFQNGGTEAGGGGQAHRRGGSQAEELAIGEGGEWRRRSSPSGRAERRTESSLSGRDAVEEIAEGAEAARRAALRSAA